MENIVEKSLMTSSTGSSKPETDLREIHRKLQLIQRQIQQQNACLSRIKNIIPYLPQTKLSGSNAKYLAPIESSDE